MSPTDSPIPPLADHCSPSPAQPAVLLDRPPAHLAGLGAGRGMVLMLDDLHWADPGTAELIDHLIHHPPAGPVVLATV